MWLILQTSYYFVMTPLKVMKEVVEFLTFPDCLGI